MDECTSQKVAKPLAERQLKVLHYTSSSSQIDWSSFDISFM